MKSINNLSLPIVEVSPELLRGLICEIPEEYEYEYEEDGRKLYLEGAIVPTDTEGNNNETSSAKEIVKQIMEYNDADKGIPIQKRKPIRLFINSPGGDLHEGMSLVEIIRASKTPIYTINLGRCASMAFLIFIVGHKRLSLRNMTFLCHDGFIALNSSTSKARDIVSFYNQMNDSIEDIIVSYGKMDREEFRRRRHEEIYMLPEQAKEYGFVDEIVTDIDHIL